jgi:hypothetical protein
MRVAYLLPLLLVTTLRAQTVYVDGFESGDVAGWSTIVTDPGFQRPITISRTPAASRGFLGDFGNQTVRFATAGLPRHDSVVVELDLYVIDSWDGNRGSGDGPDVLSITDAERGSLLRTTFTNKDELRQAYPDAYPGGDNPATSGASARSILGYAAGDAIYHLRFAYPHTGSSIALTFAAELRDRFPTLENESWGIDNVVITAVPPRPAAATLVAGTAKGAPGESVMIPIYVRDVVSVVSSGATAVRTRVRFNGSMLVPTSPTPMGFMEGRDRVIDIDLPLYIAGDSSIARLSFRVVVGDDTVTAITLEGSAAVGGEITFRERAGTFTVKGLCTDGGTRLFREEPAALLRAPSPNPVRDHAALAYTTAADGPVRLELIDGNGAIVALLVDGMIDAGDHTVDIDAASLPSGAYVVRLRAGGSVAEQRLVVLR